MWARFVFLFILTSQALAETSFEGKISELSKGQRDEMFRLRVQHSFKTNVANDAYVEDMMKLKDKHLIQTLELYESECKLNPKNCLTETEKKEKEAQVRIEKGLITRRNEWLKEGLSPDEVKKRQASYLKESKEEGSSSSSPDPGPTSASLDKKDLLKGLEEELKKLDEAFEKNFKNKEVTVDYLKAYKELQIAKLDKTLKVHDELCKKEKDNTEVCLTEEAKQILADKSASATCLIERKHNIFSAPDKTKVRKLEDLLKHEEDWKGLNPKDCKLLIQKDKTPQGAVQVPVQTEAVQTPPPVETVQEINQEDEDKRNYISSECKWVTNIPRKVVTGVSCGSSKNNICVGYVSCPRRSGPGSFTRMSTCRASYCGPNDAIKCTQDPGYWSRKPSGEDKEYVSPEIKKILKTTRQ